MISKIKSCHILKHIFSFIKLKPKLNIINFNKKLMNLLKLNINDIKHVSGKYKIIEGNGLIKLGKIFSLKYNTLLFFGEFINGKKSGYGIEYDLYYDNKIIFEGNFLNNKKHGLGIEYRK